MFLYLLQLCLSALQSGRYCLNFTPFASPYIPNGLYQAAFLFSQKIALYIATFLHPHGRFLCILYNSAKTETAQLQSLFLQNPVHTMHG